MLAIIEAAGWPIWPLLLTSCILLAVIVERAMVLRTSRILPKGLFNDVAKIATNRQIAADTLQKLAQHSPLGQILASGLRSRQRSRAEIKETLEEQGQAIYHVLTKRLNVLSTIAALAPLMGLFGTVIGMIEIFGSYSSIDSDPAQLAQGISIALYNTGLGIFIAMPALIAYRYFQSHISQLTHDLERNASQLLDVIHPL